MKEQVGKRIKSARVLAGLSLRDLSELLKGKISHTAISKYEKGQMMPGSTNLINLAKALGVSLDYLLRPHTVEISKIEFRKKGGLPQKKLNSIKEEIKDHIERYIELESFLNIQNLFENPIENIIINNPEEVEEVVEKLLLDWDLGFNALPNIIEMLEEKDIRVIEIEADPKFDGLAGWANREIPLMVINKNYGVERKRFTALHELGHLILNINPELEKKDIEKICHRFAGAMLVPRQTLFKELGIKRSEISLNELIYIKETYGISIQAIMARARDLDIITKEHFIRFRIKVNQDQNLKYEREGLGAYQGIEHSARFKKLLFRAAAEELISMNKAASLANQKLIEFREEFMTL